MHMVSLAALLQHKGHLVQQAKRPSLPWKCQTQSSCAGRSVSTRMVKESLTSMQPTRALSIQLLEQLESQLLPLVVYNVLLQLLIVRSNILYEPARTMARTQMEPPVQLFSMPTEHTLWPVALILPTLLLPRCIPHSHASSILLMHSTWHPFIPIPYLDTLHMASPHKHDIPPCPFLCGKPRKIFPLFFSASVRTSLNASSESKPVSNPAIGAGKPVHANLPGHKTLKVTNRTQGTGHTGHR